MKLPRKLKKKLKALMHAQLPHWEPSEIRIDQYKPSNYPSRHHWAHVGIGNRVVTAFRLIPR